MTKAKRTADHTLVAVGAMQVMAAEASPSSGIGVMMESEGALTDTTTIEKTSLPTAASTSNVMASLICSGLQAANAVCTAGPVAGKLSSSGMVME